jgi:hypothetical protein
MNKNHYTPRQNGVAGIEDFGDIEHGTNYEECRPVYVDGVKVCGPTYEPALVAEFFRKGGRIEHGGTVIAKGAHRFTPNWDYRVRTDSALLGDRVGIFNPGCSRTLPVNIGDYENDER